MLASDPMISEALSTQLLGLAQVVGVAGGFGWTAYHLIDPGIRARGLPILAGLAGLYGGGWVARLTTVDLGPSIWGYGLVPSFLGALGVCALLRVVSLGLAGSRA